ncbi:MAG: macA 5 [Acidobacteria bacterium]|jgi:RND family efflux transporter MFP subunit|nr:macA 5 [Acidobacteriota bacterium]
MRWNRTALIALLAGWVLLPAGCRKKETEAAAPAEAPPVSVSVLQVQAEDLAVMIAVTGDLVSSTRVDVKAETLGRLTRFPKEEGDFVEAGEEVAWVNQENYQLAVRQAETAVQVAEAGLERTRVLAAHNQTEWERARNLVQSGGITEKDLRAAEVSHRDTQAQVLLAQAQLDQARAVLEVAQKRLRDTVILSPVSGAIEKKYVNPGAYVESSTTVFTVVDNRQLELESPVPSAQLGQVRSGQRVTFRVNSYPGVTFQGQVIEIGPAVDTATRSAKLRIRVDNSNGRLKAGMFAEGEILTGVRQRTIVVPSTAVYLSEGAEEGPFVFVVENGKAVRRGVRVGRETDSRLEIVQGLKPGDLVVTEQKIELAEGVRVEAGK